MLKFNRNITRGTFTGRSHFRINWFWTLCRYWNLYWSLNLALKVWERKFHFFCKSNFGMERKITYENAWNIHPKIRVLLLDLLKPHNAMFHLFTWHVTVANTRFFCSYLNRGDRSLGAHSTLTELTLRRNESFPFLMYMFPLFFNSTWVYSSLVNSGSFFTFEKHGKGWKKVKFKNFLFFLLVWEKVFTYKTFFKRVPAIGIKYLANSVLKWKI